MEIERQKWQTAAMAKTVQCVKLGREAEALDRPPIKGEVGQRIVENVSKDGWKLWLEHSKMLINEYRLDLTSQQGQTVWYSEMEKFFFGDGSSAPPDFVKKSGE